MDFYKSEIVFESSILPKEREHINKQKKSATVKKETYHEIYY